MQAQRLRRIWNSECEMRMSVHPKNTSETKCDWLVVAMHATEGSRNAEWCVRKCGMRNAECGMYRAYVEVLPLPNNPSWISGVQSKQSRGPPKLTSFISGNPCARRTQMRNAECRMRNVYERTSRLSRLPRPIIRLGFRAFRASNPADPQNSLRSFRGTPVLGVRKCEMRNAECGMYMSARRGCRGCPAQ